MITIERIDALREAVRQWREQGARIGFVPTMGSLHAGHMSLLAAARFRADRVIASVFVNPLQFGPGEDFERYPRTPEDDQHLLAEAGCDLLFLPSVAEMYPEGGQSATKVSVPSLSGILCGAHRPGHFDGVATVVAKLFGIVQPDVAVFGEKDYQQLAIIRRMVHDLASAGGSGGRAHRALTGWSRDEFAQPLPVDGRARGGAAPARNAARRGRAHRCGRARVRPARKRVRRAVARGGHGAGLRLGARCGNAACRRTPRASKS